MKNTNIRKWYYHIRHRYVTMDNVVVAVAIVIGASWTWGSIGMMQRNYALQKEVDTKIRQRQLAELEVETLMYQQNYYKSAEYQDLAMRQRVGVVDPGERALILPPNSKMAKDADVVYTKKQTRAFVPEDNLQQWVNFLFGVNRDKT